ncbi:hypothetical protein [Diaphorobacter caeni]|nr:hypothetical protein [Diaphorobacter caeni]MBF5004461.1 hypothetical protein [Diaphorobacter caeni]
MNKKFMQTAGLGLLGASVYALTSSQIAIAVPLACVGAILFYLSVKKS